MATRGGLREAQQRAAAAAAAEEGCRRESWGGEEKGSQGVNRTK